MRLAKDRKKGDKIVTDSQERAYWRAYRPPPAFFNCLEQAPYPPSSNQQQPGISSRSVEELKTEVCSINPIQSNQNLHDAGNFAEQCVIYRFVLDCRVLELKRI